MGTRQSSQASSSQPSDYVPTNDSSRPSQPSSSVGASNSSSLSGLSLAQRVYSEDSSPDEPPFNRLFLSHLFALRDIKCPACQKLVPSDNIECHLVMCLSRPLINYNEDTLTEDKGECSICLEEMKEGDVIARLPCLCIYHKSCIDGWFKVKRSCPEHPND